MSSPKIQTLLFPSLCLLMVLGARAAGDAAADRAIAGPVEVLASNSSGTRLLVRAGEARFLSVTTDKADKNDSASEPVRVEIDGFVATSPPGAPDLPVHTVLVAIPAGAHVELQVAVGDERTYPGIRVAPVPLPGSRPEAGKPTLWIRNEDPQFYRATYPAERVSLSPPMRIGSLEVVGVIFRPAIYDPAAAVVRVAGRMEVAVLTTGGKELALGAMAELAAEEAGRDAFALGQVVNPEAARRFVWPRPAQSGSTAPLRTAPFPAAPILGGGASFESSPNWVKVFVDARGLVRLDGARLAAAGVNLSTIDPATLRLFWGGGLDPEPGISPRSASAPTFMQECAIQVADGGDGRLDPGDAILLLGQGASGWLDDFRGGPYAFEFYEHQKEDRGVFWLTWGGDFAGVPQRMATRSATPIPATPVANRGLARIHAERNRSYQADLYEPGQKWERWWWQLLRGEDARVFFTAIPVKPDLTQPGSLHLRLWGLTSAGPVWDHFARVWFNTVPILDPADGDSVFAWDGPENPQVGPSGRQDVQSSSLTMSNGQNRLEVDILPGQLDQVMVGWFNLGYVRLLDLTGEAGAELVPTGVTGAATVEVTGAPDGARIFEVTDPRSPVELIDLERNGTTLRFAADLDPGAPAKFLIGVPPVPPAAVEVDRSLPDLRSVTHTHRAWYVVIAHDSMIDEAVRLAEAHAQVPPPEGTLPGLPLAVRVSDVYDEFGWGLKSDIAIRNFIDYAFHTWDAGPIYVCLLGDASFDPKDIFGGGRRETDFVPVAAYWNWIGGIYLGSDYLSDDYYVRTFDDALEVPPDRLTDLVIGRLPASDVEEARVMIDGKTIPYLTTPEHGLWRQRVILLADDELAGGPPPGSEWFHTQNIERASEVLPPELERVKIYLINYSADAIGAKPAARADFIQAFNEGAAFVNYVGHGAPDILAHEAAFRVENVGQLLNGHRLPFFTTFSCTVNRFDQSGTEGIGEALVAHAEGGSVASLGSTDLAFVSANQFLNNATYEQCYVGGDFTVQRSLGAAAAQAKNQLAAMGDTAAARKFTLIGDPALPPATPIFRTSTDFPAAAGPDTARLVAGIPYRMTAALTGAPPPQPPWSAQVIARDSEELRLLPIVFPPPTSYFLPASPFFRSSLEVASDTLATQLVVPVDASQSLSPGRGAGEIRVYAAGQGWDGLGVRRLFLDVVNASPVEDEPVDAPRIQATFPGDARVVAPTASLHIRFEDKSGINIVGNTPANSVFMRIDETRTVVLNELFAYEPGSATVGTVNFALPGLDEGRHVARIFASDNYLNRGEAELEFTVTVRGVTTLMRADLYPNPLRDKERGAVLSFELAEPAEVTIRIYAVSGKLVRTDFPGFDRNLGAGVQQIHWDGRDEDGDLVANGVYLCSISATGLNGDQASTVVRALVSR